MRAHVDRDRHPRPPVRRRQQRSLREPYAEPAQLAELVVVDHARGEHVAAHTTAQRDERVHQGRAARVRRSLPAQLRVEHEHRGRDVGDETGRQVGDALDGHQVSRTPLPAESGAGLGRGQAAEQAADRDDNAAGPASQARQRPVQTVHAPLVDDRMEGDPRRRDVAWPRPVVFRAAEGGAVLAHIAILLPDLGEPG